jgi:hypothetical protein
MEDPSVSSVMRRRFEDVVKDDPWTEGNEIATGNVKLTGDPVEDSKIVRNVYEMLAHSLKKFGCRVFVNKEEGPDMIAVCPIPTRRDRYAILSIDFTFNPIEEGEAEFSAVAFKIDEISREEVDEYVERKLPPWKFREV